MEPKDGFMGQRCFNEFAKSRRSNEKAIPLCPLKEEEDARFIIFFIHNLVLGLSSRAKETTDAPPLSHTKQVARCSTLQTAPIRMINVQHTKLENIWC
jgi:hypothetical protein